MSDLDLASSIEHCQSLLFFSEDDNVSEAYRRLDDILKEAESLQQQLTKSEERVKELEGAIVKHCTASCIDIDGDDNKLKWYLEVNKQD